MPPSAIARPALFAEALPRLGPRPLVAFHNDADGLSAGVILVKTATARGQTPAMRIVGKGENAFSPAFATEVQARHDSGEITGLIIADLGVSSALSVGSLPVILVDHHEPTGYPTSATVISGIADDPIPTSSLLAYRCAATILDPAPFLWLAAIGLIGDMAEGSGFAEMEAARALGITALRKAAALINAPRRSASGDAMPAFDLLMKADGPKAVLDGRFPETERLLAARDEVRRAVEDARKAPPKIVGPVALIRFSSPCQIHPLIAQSWTGRLRSDIVIAANTGYRPGWVHFAARAPRGADVLEFLEHVRPPGADEQYGKGHRAASGGALRHADWNLFVDRLGFGESMHANEDTI
ncbi:phosphoesterase [Rhizobium sp. YIM 134829]|uniref:phosphoesterase n=1 Tax=Rhizobium sp. YIM 134829 TaxID=3390453 RepID=UPI0039782F0A